jgi:hypothetical protein
MNTNTPPTEMKTRSQMEYGVKTPVEEVNRLEVLAEVALKKEVYMVDYHRLEKTDTKCHIIHMGMKFYHCYLIDEVLRAAKAFANHHGVTIMGTYHKVYEAPHGGFDFRSMGNMIFVPE